MDIDFSKANLTVGALLVSAAVSASLLAGAHIFEAAGYLPCQLCLDQREAHWTALALASAGLFLSFLVRARAAAAAAVGAVAFVYALSAGLAFFHTGVEFGYWPAIGCDAAAVDLSNMTSSNFEAALRGETSTASCSDPEWRLLGVSMAGYNFLFSAGLFAICLAATVAATRARRAAFSQEPRFAG